MSSLQFNAEGKCVHVPYADQLPQNRFAVLFFVYVGDGTGGIQLHGVGGV
jgi:hypothetical protein